MDFLKIHFRKIIIISILAILSIIFLRIYYHSQVTASFSKAIETPQNTTIKVNIQGEIINPGTYELPINSTLKDLINISSGFTSEADTSLLDLNSILTDGMQITIPKIVSNFSTQLISINNANLSELQTLPGIGPSKAQKIIDYRTKYGKFQTISEIQNVNGIGPSTYAKIKKYLTL